MAAHLRSAQGPLVKMLAPVARGALPVINRLHCRERDQFLLVRTVTQAGSQVATISASAGALHPGISVLRTHACGSARKWAGSAFEAVAGSIMQKNEAMPASRDFTVEFPLLPSNGGRAALQ